MADVVEIILKLSQVRQFTAGADQASKSIGKVGTAAEKSGKQAGVSWKSIAKWGGAATAAYGAQKFLRGAVDATEELGQSTLALNRTTGMSIQTGAQWATVLKSRNVSTNLFQRGLVTLSKNMQKTTDAAAISAMKVAQLGREYDAVKEKGGKGVVKALDVIQRKIDRQTAKGKDAVSLWQKLGVSMADVRKGRTEQVLMQVSDAFARMKNPAERAAIAQKLFSRSGIALAPMLFKGSKAIREQLKIAGKYVGFNDKNAEQVKQSIADQRELRMAYMGVQVSLGKALLPIMLSLSQIVLKITNMMAPFIKRGWMVKAAIIAMTAAFVAWKVATIAATIAQMSLNAVFAASGIGAIIIAVAALAFGIYKLWKNSKTFRDMVYAVWNALKWTFDWVKSHWQLLAAILLGPVAIAALAIMKYWKQIKAGAEWVWNWIKRNWPYLVGILLGPWGIAAAAIYKHFGAIKQFVLGVIAAIKKAIQDLLKWILSIPTQVGNVLKKIPGAGTALKVGGKAAGVVSHVPVVGGLFGQYGASVPMGGTVRVGEAGPELVHLPAHARVQPIGSGFAGAGGGTIEVRVPVFLDKRQIAEAVGQFTADKLARR